MLYQNIQELVELPDVFMLSDDEGFRAGQIGHMLHHANDIDQASLILISSEERRGNGPLNSLADADELRRKLYAMYLWHNDVQLADAGTIKPGKTLADSYAAISMVISELLQAGKRVLFFGGSHDLTLAIYKGFGRQQQLIEATAIDALIDLDREAPFAANRFLYDMLTGEPNYVRHFNLLGFQSYFTNPVLLETIDKLRFDCYRVGKVQEAMDEVEPVIRSSHLVSFDMQAMAHCYAPGNRLSPNGFTGQEACKLMQYAGMSARNRVTALHHAGADSSGLTAMQQAQMMWYFIDGMQKQLHEVHISDRSGYNEYHTLCAEVDTLFLQSRNTGRWWMQLPDEQFIPCTYADYVVASRNDLPERWLRAQERM